MWATGVSAAFGNPLTVLAWATKEGSFRRKVLQEVLRRVARGVGRIVGATASAAYVSLRYAQDRIPHQDEWRTSGGRGSTPR